MRCKQGRRLWQELMGGVLMVMLCGGSMPGCKSCLPDVAGPLKDTTDRTLAVLDQGINALQNESSNWQSVLQNMIGDLTEQAQATVRNELTDLLNGTIASAGDELRCNVDFLGVRALQVLQRIKAKLLGQSLPPASPHLCKVVPAGIDRSRVESGSLSLLAIHGFDLNAAGVSLFVRSGGLETLAPPNSLAHPTPYEMSVNLGSNGVPLTATSDLLVFRVDGVEFATVAVIQPNPRICRTQSVTFKPSALTFVPEFSGGGDRDFAGHGPMVTLRVALYALQGQVKAFVFMQAVESHPDGRRRENFTEARGFRFDTVYTPPTGWQVSSILGELSMARTYFDTTVNRDDRFDEGNGPVMESLFVGDTSGDEAGSRTQVTIKWNQLRLELTERGDCVPRQVARQVISAGAASTPVLRSLEVNVAAP